MTASGAVPEVGVTVSIATGGSFAGLDAVKEATALPTAPPESATCTVAVQFPAA